VKRRIEIRIDELRLPAGSRAGLRVRDEIAAAVARLAGGTPSPARADRTAGASDAIAGALHERIAPHLPSSRTERTT
jgi:hypothetical protein